MDESADEILLLDTSTESFCSSISERVNFPLKRYQFISTLLIILTTAIVNAHLYMH